MLSTLIILHIIAGAIALIFGFMTIATTKGNARHKRYGKVYVVAMLLLGTTGTIVAVIREIPLSMLNGAVLCYFVLSSISAIRNAEYKISVFDKWLTVFSWVLVAAFAWCALQVTQTESGQLGGFGVAEYIVFGTVMLFAGIADIRYLLKSGLSTIQKLVRHLWRMFFPLFMATAAFFFGQAKLFPEVLKSIEILAIPVVFVILSMIYWLVMVVMRKSAFR